MNVTDLIKLNEGLRLKPYRCTAGKLSIGWGRNLDDVGISEEEALVLLKNDIERAVNDLDKNLPWWRSMNETRQAVLIDMTFNLGIKGLLGFKNTLKACQEGRYKEAADGMGASKWAVQVGSRATRLIDMMRNG